MSNPTPGGQTEPTHASLVIDGQATPSHENGDRALSNLPSTRQRPLTPATAPGSPVVPRSGYHTHAHRKKCKTKPKEKTKRLSPASNSRKQWPKWELRDVRDIAAEYAQDISI